VRCMVNYDDCQITREEVLAALEMVWNIAEWLLAKQNWGRVLGDCGKAVAQG